MFKRAIMEFNVFLLIFIGWFYISYIVMSYIAFRYTTTDCTWRSCKSYCGFSISSVCLFILHATIGFLYCCCNDASTYWVARRYSLISLMFELLAFPKCFSFKKAIAFRILSFSLPFKMLFSVHQTIERLENFLCHII